MGKKHLIGTLKTNDQATLIYDFFHENEKALLIVLDACNWHVLSALKPSWNINVVFSRGSCTPDWLERTFIRPLKDVVTYLPILIPFS